MVVPAQAACSLGHCGCKMSGDHSHCCCCHRGSGEKKNGNTPNDGSSTKVSLVLAAACAGGGSQDGTSAAPALNDHVCPTASFPAPLAHAKVLFFVDTFVPSDGFSQTQQKVPIPPPA